MAVSPVPSQLALRAPIRRLLLFSKGYAVRATCSTRKGEYRKCLCLGCEFPKEVFFKYFATHSRAEGYCCAREVHQSPESLGEKPRRGQVAAMRMRCRNFRFLGGQHVGQVLLCVGFRSVWGSLFWGPAALSQVPYPRVDPPDNLSQPDAHEPLGVLNGAPSAATPPRLEADPAQLRGKTVNLSQTLLWRRLKQPRLTLDRRMHPVRLRRRTTSRPAELRPRLIWPSLTCTSGRRQTARHSLQHRRSMDPVSCSMAKREPINRYLPRSNGLRSVGRNGATNTDRNSRSRL